MPWRRFEGVGVRSKENAVSRERWSEVRLKQQAGAVRKQAAPFAVYSEGRRSVGQAVLGGSQSEKMGDLNGQLGSVVGQAEGCGWFGGQGNGQSVGQSVGQFVSQPVNQSINQSINSSIHQQINQNTIPSTNQSINQNTTQSTNPFTNQSNPLTHSNATTRLLQRDSK